MNDQPQIPMTPPRKEKVKEVGIVPEEACEGPILSPPKPSGKKKSVLAKFLTS